MFLVPLVQCLCSISLKILKGEMLGILGQDTEKKVVNMNMPNVVFFCFTGQKWIWCENFRKDTVPEKELPNGQMACSMQRQKFVRNFEARNSPSSTIWSEPRLLFRDQSNMTPWLLPKFSVNDIWWFQYKSNTKKCIQLSTTSRPRPPMWEVISSSFHDFLAARLPKTRTPNQKHGHVFEAILQLVPETGTPHTTPPPHHRKVEILGFFFHRSCFLVCFFSLLPYCLSQKTKIVHARKTNLEPENGFQKEYPFPRNPPIFRFQPFVFWETPLAVFDFVGNLHPPENAPIPGRWTVVWVVTSNISIIAAQSLHQ